MKLGLVTNKNAASASKWIDFDMEGYEDNLRKPADQRIKFLLKPQTRSIINDVEKSAEAQLKARGRSKYQDDDTLPSGAMDRGDYMTREMAKALVEDWAGVADAATGEDIECNDHHKVWLFENLDIALWVIEEARKLVSVRIEDEEKN